MNASYFSTLCLIKVLDGWELSTYMLKYQNEHEGSQMSELDPLAALVGLTRPLGQRPLIVEHRQLLRRLPDQGFWAEHKRGLYLMMVDLCIMALYCLPKPQSKLLWRLELRAREEVAADMLHERTPEHLARHLRTMSAEYKVYMSQLATGLGYVNIAAVISAQ